MASIIKLQGAKGVKYRVVIRRKGHKPTSKTFPVRKEAIAWAKTIEGELRQRDAYPGAAAKQKTLAQAIDRFVREYDKKDKNIFGRLHWWREHLGDRKLEQITPFAIADALDVLANEPLEGRARGSSNEGKKRSGPTINRYHAGLSSVLQKAAGKWKWISENPARKITRNKENEGCERFLSRKERTALLAAAKRSEWPGLHLAILMAISTGARRRELFELTWQDIDFQKREARLSDTKNSAPRGLPLIPQVVEGLRLTVRRLDTQLIFFDPTSPQRSMYARLRPYFQKAIAEAGIEPLRWHDLRHSCASFLIDAGVPDLVIAAILGHKSLAMTKRYSHLRDGKKREIVDNVFGKMEV